MKIYPKRTGAFGEIQIGFSNEEIKDGTIYLFCDVECTNCGHIMTLADAGSTDNGKCTRCGGQTK